MMCETLVFVIFLGAIALVTGLLTFAVLNLLDYLGIVEIYVYEQPRQKRRPRRRNPYKEVIRAYKHDHIRVEHEREAMSRYTERCMHRMALEAARCRAIERNDKSR